MNQPIIKEQNITQKLLNFIKYNNAFVIGLVLVLFAAGAIFAASPDARSAVAGKEIVTVRGVDNSRIINADLGNFDFQMKIDNVTEDAANYYVEYSFRTIGIEANAWQTITRNLQMTVAKDALAGQDLGLYVQTQLANVAQNELAYLEQAQAAEKEKGLTQIVRTTEYTGLIGLVLDVKNAVLPGYDPVVKPEPAELAQTAEPQPPQEPETLLEPELAENATTTLPEIVETAAATTTKEIAAEEPVATTTEQVETMPPQEAAPAEAATTTEAQVPQPQENQTSSAASATEEQTGVVSAETAAEPENIAQTGEAAGAVVASETPAPDTAATSAAEQ